MTVIHTQTDAIQPTLFDPNDLPLVDADPTLAVDQAPESAPGVKAVLGSRAVTGALSDSAPPVTDSAFSGERSISGLSPAASARETQAALSQLADSLRRRGK